MHQRDVFYLLEVLQCSPLFFRTDTFPFYSRAFSKQPTFPHSWKLPPVTQVLFFKLHAKWCHVGASLLDQFPQKTNVFYYNSCLKYPFNFWKKPSYKAILLVRSNKTVQRLSSFLGTCTRGPWFKVGCTFGTFKIFGMKKMNMRAHTTFRHVSRLNMVYPRCVHVPLYL